MSDRKRQKLAVFLSILLLTFVILIFGINNVKGSEGHQQLGFIGYIRFFMSAFISTFSLRGLMKSVPWAVMGIGIGTSMIGFVSILRFMNNRRSSVQYEHISKKLIISSIVWALPFLMLWIWQPVPILRHYFLAVPPIAFIAGAYFQKLPGKRLTLFIVVTILLNLALPELLYRTYNSRRHQALKEPHGAFFYYHARTCDRISRYLSLQKEVVHLAEDDRGIGDTIFVPASWEMFAYLLYGMAQTSCVRRLPDSESSRGYKVRNYILNGHLIIIEDVPSFSFKVIPSVIKNILEEASTKNYIIVIPREVMSAIKPMSKTSLQYLTY